MVYEVLSYVKDLDVKEKVRNYASRKEGNFVGSTKSAGETHYHVTFKDDKNTKLMVTELGGTGNLDGTDSIQV